MTDWEISEYKAGWKLQNVKNEKKYIEVLPQTGGDWAADMMHKYGCTRLVLMDTDDGIEVLEKLVYMGMLSPDKLP